MDEKLNVLYLCTGNSCRSQMTEGLTRATAVMLFGLSSGAALATVVGVLIEVPVMLMLVKIYLKTEHLFKK